MLNRADLTPLEKHSADGPVPQRNLRILLLSGLKMVTVTTSRFDPLLKDRDCVGLATFVF